MRNGFSGRALPVAEAIDRHGADFSRWPDPMLANQARAAVLADRELRAYRDAAVALERGLQAARGAFDADILTSGAVGRVAAAVSRGMVPWRPIHIHWLPVAAALVIAAGLGGIFDMTVVAPASQTRSATVNVDPLVFATAEDGLQ